MRVQLHAVSFTGAMRFGANLEFDVAEYSLANYCAHLAEPKPSPMVPLPVFASRVFRHNSIYVNDASNIVDAGDLAGRAVGIPQWSQTATVYVRGFLTHDAGVPVRSIRWVQAGVGQPGRRGRVSRQVRARTRACYGVLVNPE